MSLNHFEKTQIEFQGLLTSNFKNVKCRIDESDELKWQLSFPLGINLIVVVCGI